MTLSWVPTDLTPLTRARLFGLRLSQPRLICADFIGNTSEAIGSAVLVNYHKRVSHMERVLG